MVHCWINRRGLTLLGDAAHVMSPFGGEGVNTVMLDAAELARLLIDSQDWAAAVAQYETQMFARVVDAAEASADAAATRLSHDGPALTVAMYRSHHAVPDISLKGLRGHRSATGSADIQPAVRSFIDLVP